jgi:hypothetical protein
VGEAASRIRVWGRTHTAIASQSSLRATAASRSVVRRAQAAGSVRARRPAARRVPSSLSENDCETWPPGRDGLKEPADARAQ